MSDKPKYPSSHFRLEDNYREAIVELIGHLTRQEKQQFSQSDVVRLALRRTYQEEFGQRKAEKLFEELR